MDMVTVKRDITLKAFEAFDVEGEDQVVVCVGTQGAVEPSMGSVVEVMFSDGPLRFDVKEANYFLDFHAGAC